MNTEKLSIYLGDECLHVLDAAKATSASVGRDSSNDIVLSDPSGMVSRQHGVFNHFAGIWWYEDKNSSYGSYIGERRISREPLVDGTELRLGNVTLRLKSLGDPNAQDDWDSGNWQPLRYKLGDELVKNVNFRKLQEEAPSDQILEERLHGLGKLLIEKDAAAMRLPTKGKEKLLHAIVGDILRLGPLEPLLADDTITEIMVVGPDHVYVERKGEISLSPTRFRDSQHLRTVIERIVTPLGRRIDESSPLVDARLRDGSRVNAVIPPISPERIGPLLTIRKFGKDVFTTDRLLQYGSITEPMRDFLRLCVEVKKNIVVSGGTGSGKTSLLNALSTFIGSNERIITIEDALELKLQQPHVVSLEARPPNTEGRGEVSIRALVRNSLRMRPDRIVVGECRGGEALDMLQAMNTGHDGSLTTVHANSPRDAISRLETLVLMAGMDLPLTAIQHQIFSAVDIIVQTSRLMDHSRKVVYITEIVKDSSGRPVIREHGLPEMRDIFRFEQSGLQKNHEGKLQVIGKHVALGKPSFFDALVKSGFPIREEWFIEQDAQQNAICPDPTVRKGTAP
ncbi:MAG: Flp pilus assembly complex ATPase component TadA [Lentisphaerae bacterium]|nr:Flp pilus assembly complex ATPase component TadA [Lentisphaerota bacterium]